MGIAISPVPLVAVILMLTPRGRANGIAEAFGRIGSIGVLTAPVAAFGGGMQTSGQPARQSWFGVVFFCRPSSSGGTAPARARKPNHRRGCRPSTSSTRQFRRTGRGAGLAHPKNPVLVVGGAIAGLLGDHHRITREGGF
ncbi:hypothetical protein [Streptomyces sp. CBMA123]|uniref:hypothetical protein n=1 Tax=Streptomyces sp. CBMA123 TaxID=1896313 RepID=UPI001661B576|nr:hypothetical protein [Streptomyces sp. CBMA123]